MFIGRNWSCIPKAKSSFYSLANFFDKQSSDLGLNVNSVPRSEVSCNNVLIESSVDLMKTSSSVDTTSAITSTSTTSGEIQTSEELFDEQATKAFPAEDLSTSGTSFSVLWLGGEGNSVNVDGLYVVLGVAASILLVGSLVIACVFYFGQRGSCSFVAE
jgi:hypothetical protein